MPEYFKFCPKCGRVLNREWCTHCEPEKEEAYRREQMRKYQIEGDYMSDKGIGLDVHGMFGSIGSGIDHAFKKQDKEQTYEYSYRDQEQFEKKEKKVKKVHQAQSVGRSVKKVSIITLLSCILGFLVAIKALLGFVDLSDFSLPSAIESFFDVEDDYDEEDMETISALAYRDYTDDIDTDFDAFASTYFFSSNTYSTDLWDGEDTSYGAYVTEYYFKDSDEVQAEEGIASTIGDQYEACRETADTCCSEKIEGDYYVNSYVTFRDDSYANLIIEETLDENSGSGAYSTTIHSYFINMDTLEAVDLEKKLEDQDIKASQFADNIAETINDSGYELSKDEVKDLLKEKTYYYCVNKDGEIYIAVPYEKQYYNTELWVDDASVNIYDSLDI